MTQVLQIPYTLCVVGLTAAETLGAPGVGAQKCGRVFHGDVAVGARKVRAKRLAALGNLAHASVTHRILCIFDGGVVVRASDRVAHRLRPFDPCVRDEMATKRTKKVQIPGKQKRYKVSAAEISGGGHRNQNSRWRQKP